MDFFRSENIIQGKSANNRGGSNQQFFSNFGDQCCKFSPKVERDLEQEELDLLNISWSRDGG